MEAILKLIHSATDSMKVADRKQVAAVAACSLVALGSVATARRWLHGRRLPPGPAGLPILGCVQLNDQSRWHIELEELGKKHNGLFSFYYGTQLIVVVTSYDLMKEMLEGPNFAGRHHTPLSDKVIGRTGIAITEGEDWNHHRRLSLRILRDFGFAKETSFDMLLTAMETVYSSVHDSIERGQPTKKMLGHFLDVSNSVIAQLIFGRLFTRSDPEFVKFCDAASEFFKVPLLSVLDKYYALNYLASKMPLSFMKTIATMRNFATRIVRERAAIVTEEGTEPECLCDVYIQEKRKAEKNGDFHTYREEQMIGVCFDFFLAGTDTTARSIEWMVLMMAFHPEVQQKVHSELDDVVGRSGSLRLSDKSRLHYTCATIEECYRMAPIGALGVFHRTTEDTDFHGYLIPKDSLILPFQYAVLHDEKYWDSPHNFMPGRFLDYSGRFKSSSHVIPFLMGKRACVGESLARMEIFGMFAALLQRYEVRPTPECLARRDDVLTPRLRLALEPGDYELDFVRR